VVRAEQASVIATAWCSIRAALIAEIRRSKEQGVARHPRICASPKTPRLILPLHQELDVAREKASGKGPSEPPGRGIGPAYETRSPSRHPPDGPGGPGKCWNGKIERRCSRITMRSAAALE